jgi:hypothetical protein
LAAARRRLTGTARGGAFAIARHSLRWESWARAATLSDPSKANTESSLNMARSRLRRRPQTVSYRRIRHPSWWLARIAPWRTLQYDPGD